MNMIFINSSRFSCIIRQGDLLYVKGCKNYSYSKWNTNFYVVFTWSLCYCYSGEDEEYQWLRYPVTMNKILSMSLIFRTHAAINFSGRLLFTILCTPKSSRLPSTVPYQHLRGRCPLIMIFICFIYRLCLCHMWPSYYSSFPPRY